MTTWNPSDKQTDIVLSFGNTVASISGSIGGVRSTTSKSSGKIYFEVVATSASEVCEIGIANSSADITSFLGGDGNSVVYLSNGNIVFGGSGNSVNTYTDGDVIGVAVDLPNHLVYFALNNAWQNSANPASGAGGTNYLTSANPMFAAVVMSASGSESVTEKFGPSFTYTPPSGYSAWDLTATNVNLVGVSATASVGTITVNSPDKNVSLLGVVATSAVGALNKQSSPNVSITGVSVTASAGSIIFGGAAGSLTASETADTASFGGNAGLAGSLVASEARDTASIRGHYGFIGWIPVNVQDEVWTER